MVPFPKQGIGSPADLGDITKLVRPESFKKRTLIAPYLDKHHASIQHFVDLGQ